MISIDLAKEYSASGLNVLPACLAKKRPAGYWKCYQFQKFADFNDFSRNDALCVVCGKISGNLEVLDFDCQGAFYQPWRDEVARHGGTAILDKLVIEQSPSGGYHAAYRTILNVGKNQEFAYNDQGKIAIETRGEGGIVLIDPSPNYRTIQGDWRKLAVLNDMERELLIVTAMNLSQKIRLPPQEHPQPPKFNVSKPQKLQEQERERFTDESVADKLRNEGVARKILEDNGWVYLFTVNDYEQWRRPGKCVGQSGSLFLDTHLFKCFTSNAPPLESGQTYTPLALYAAFYHNNDLSAASKELAKKYRLFSVGTPNKKIPLEIDFTFGDEKKMTSSIEFSEDEDEDESDEKCPVFPESILAIDGFLGDMATYTKSIAYKWQPELAFAGAFACLSFMTARRIRTPNNCRPNIYCVCVSGAGTGKEAPRIANKNVVRFYDDFYKFPENFESKQAFVKYLLNEKQVFYQSDELGRLLKVVNNPRSPAYLTALIDEWLKLFSSSGVNHYSPSVCAADAKNSTFGTIDQPHFTLYGSTNPTDFFQSFSSDSITNGFIPRCFFFEGRPDVLPIRRSLNDSINSDVPESLQNIAQSWRQFHATPTTPGVEQTPEPFIVRFNTDAEKILSAFQFDELESSQKNDAPEVYARAFEKTLKTALIFAASKFGANENLIIDHESAALAVEFNRYQLNLFKFWSDQYIADTPFEAETKKVLQWLKKKKEVQYKDFTRRFYRFDPKRREDILMTLKDQERIRLEEIKTATNKKKIIVVL